MHISFKEFPYLNMHDSYSYLSIFTFINVRNTQGHKSKFKNLQNKLNILMDFLLNNVITRYGIDNNGKGSKTIFTN
jgi:hypothetical protein